MEGKQPLLAKSLLQTYNTQLVLNKKQENWLQPAAKNSFLKPSFQFA